MYHQPPQPQQLFILWVKVAWTIFPVEILALEYPVGLLVLPYICAPYQSDDDKTYRTFPNGVHIPRTSSNDRKVSWTCHEHADAWSRSGSLSAAGQSGVSLAGLVAGAGGVNHQSINPDSVLGSRKVPRGHDADSEVVRLEGGSRQAAAAEPSVADQGDSKTNIGSSIGKHGKGLGVLAKIKGRFGRHAG